MRAIIGILALLLVVPSIGWTQQLLVFPAVSDELPGRHGSLWVTNVRLVKADWHDEVVVRRAWVCLENGGFEDMPDEAPTWSMVDQSNRMLLLTGGDLLPDSDRVGAVGLVVEGGEMMGHAYVADARHGAYSDPDEIEHGDPPGRWAFGQGQLVAAIKEPLAGPSHIPWLGGCLNNPCSRQPPEYWDFLRNNIGLVNPNPEPMTFEGTVIPFGFETEGWPGGWIGELPQQPPETFTKTVPAYGWLQFRWVSTTRHPDGGDVRIGPPANGFIVSLTPDSDLPYYAYVSVVFTPDPSSDSPQFNDPMFVPAEPGFVVPLWYPETAEQSRGEPRHDDQLASIR